MTAPASHQYSNQLMDESCKFKIKKFPQTFSFFAVFLIIIGQSLVQRESGVIFSEIQLLREKIPLSPIDESVYHMQLHYAIVILGSRIIIYIAPRH